MAFGDRKIRFIGPMCEYEDCKRPQRFYYLCAAHWRAATPAERRLAVIIGTAAPHQETCTEHSVQRLLDGVEAFLRDPQQRIASHEDVS